MKKLISILVFICAMTSDIFAQQPQGGTKKVSLELKIKKHPNKGHRVPGVFDIDVSYDPEEQIVEVNSDSNWDGEVYLYSPSNIVVDYSPMINCTFNVAEDPAPYYYIVVTTDIWEASGIITK